MGEDFKVHSIEPLKDAEFSATEKKEFESAFRAIARHFNRFGTIKRVDEKLQTALYDLARDAKARLNGAEFQGLTAKEGFGMQPIVPRDVSTNDTDVWDATWTNAGTNGWVLWLGNGAFGATVPATPSIVPRSANDDVWNIAMWGAYSIEDDPIFQKVRVLVEKKEVGDHDIESQLRNSEDGYADFGRIYYTTGNPLHSYGVLAQIRQVSVGTLHFAPAGVIFGSARRLYQTGTAIRQVAIAA